MAVCGPDPLECVCEHDDPCTCGAPVKVGKRWKVREHPRFTVEVARLRSGATVIDATTVLEER